MVPGEKLIPDVFSDEELDEWMVKQYDISWMSLDPTKGSEINKTRPGVVISPDDANKFLNTVIIAPLTSTFKNFPMRLEVSLNGKKGQIALDQTRSIISCVCYIKLAP